MSDSFHSRAQDVRKDRSASAILKKQSAAIPSPLRAQPRLWPAVPVCVLIFLTTLLIYSPALHGGFLWDDGGHVTKPELRSLAGLARIWFEVGATQQYYPLLHSAFWIEHRLWGDATLGYHLANLFEHATAACLLGLLLRRLAIPGAWLAALLFAVHPVCVESVAWISEQKNTLSLVFYLCAALAYLRFDRQRGAADYVVATLFFLLALLSKTTTASLPAALLLLLWWQRNGLNWRRDVVPLLPWFVTAAAMGWLTSRVEHDYIGAQGADFELSFLQRGLIAGRVICFYLGKLLWPADLIFIYPRWKVDPSVAWQYLFPAGVLAMAAGTWLSKRRGLFVGFALFVVALFPALGFINVYPFKISFVADHFQYLASLPIFALMAAGAALAMAKMPGFVGGGIAALGLALLGVLTGRQSANYRNVFALYDETLRRDPSCWMAHNNLGEALVEAGRPTEALPHFARAVELHPGFAEAENNLGVGLRNLSRPQEAIPHLERAVQIDPGFVWAENNLGVALMAAGRTAESIPRFQHALLTHPQLAEVHGNLGIALMASGKVDEGVRQFGEALRLDSTLLQVRRNLGLALSRSGRLSEARTQLLRVVELDPASVDARLQLATVLALLNEPERARIQFQKAIELGPFAPDSYRRYGQALTHAGNFADAVPQFQRAVQLAPERADLHLNLAVALRELGRGQEAERHFDIAGRLDPTLMNGR